MLLGHAKIDIPGALEERDVLPPLNGLWALEVDRGL
jgi:hypothetical protein